GLVDQRPLLSQALESLPDPRTYGCFRLPRPGAAADGLRLEERPAASSIQEPVDLILGEGPAAPAAVEPRIHPGYTGERVQGKPLLSNAPVGKPNDRAPVLVQVSWRHPLFPLGKEPALQGGRAQVGKPREVTVACNHLDPVLVTVDPVSVDAPHGL